MRRLNPWIWPACAVTAVLLAGCAGMAGSKTGTSFFVTSVGSGKGGDLGGLAGAVPGTSAWPSARIAVTLRVGRSDASRVRRPIFCS